LDQASLNVIRTCRRTFREPRHQCRTPCNRKNKATFRKRDN
jgi:hypothetical protein